MIFRERWKDIPGFDGRYEISTHGKIRSKGWYVEKENPLVGFSRHYVKPRLLTPSKAKTGYMKVTLQKAGNEVTCSVHVLLAETFIGPRPEGLQVCHNNGDRADNRFSNIRYATPSENNHDKKLHGTQQIGSKNPRASITEDTAASIKRALEAGIEQQTTIASRHGVSKHLVFQIKHGKSWKHI